VPAVSGVLLALSFPPLHSLVPPFVGLVPFALWVHALPPDAAGRQAARRGAMVFGTVYLGLLFYWILVALLWFTKLAIPAFLATMGILVGLTILFGALMHRGLHTLRAPLWLVLPVTWTALEWARAHLPSTMAFPWLGLGTSLTGFPELVGIAELVGSRGVTFWIALVNALVAGLILRWRDSAPWARQAAVTALVVAVPMAWGVRRARTLETRDVARVAVVQPNIPEHIKLDVEAGRDSTFMALDRLLPGIEPGSVDLVVLPEVTLSLFPRTARFAPEVARVQAYSRELGAPIVFGALGFTSRDDGGFTAFNSAFVMEPQGLADFQYDKHFLVPIVERVPFVPAEVLDGLPTRRVPEVRAWRVPTYCSTSPTTPGTVGNRSTRAPRRYGSTPLTWSCEPSKTVWAWPAPRTPASRSTWIRWGTSMLPPPSSRRPCASTSFRRRTNGPSTRAMGILWATDLQSAHSACSWRR